VQGILQVVEPAWVLIVCLLAVPVSFAQSHTETSGHALPNPTIDQILSRYEAAIGGREAWEKLTTRVMKATLTLSGTAPQELSVEVYQQAPDKYLNVTSFPSGTKTEIGFNGEVGWTKDSNRGVRRLTGLELDMTKHMAGFNEVFDLRHAFPQMVLLEARRRQGRLMYVIQTTTAEGHTGTMYFDSEDGLRVRVTSTNASGQAYDDYIEEYCYLADVGIKYPCRQREVYPGYTVIVRMTDIRHNIPIDTSLFLSPSFGYKIER
jgi:outer membrane lipoprotein-sorting protein